MKKTKVIAFLLSCAIMCTALVGCTSIFPSGKSFGTVAGKPINIDLYESYIRYQLSMLTQQGATPDQIRELLNKEENGKKGSDSLKESVLNYVSTIVAVEKLAKENNIEITGDDKAAIKKDKDSIVEQYQGRAKFVEALKEQHMTEEVFDMLAVHSKLLEKVQKALFNEGGKYAPSKEDVTKKILDGNIRAIHILVQAQSTDKDFAAKKTKAEGILARVKKGEDFNKLMTELGEDPGMKSNPDGYIFNKQGALATDPGSTFDPTFTAEAFKLGVNQTSGLVTSSSGIHIIKRLPLDAAYVEKNISTFFPAFSGEAFQAKLEEVRKTLEVKTNDAYKKMDVASYIETPEEHAKHSTSQNSGGQQQAPQQQAPQQQAPQQQAPQQQAPPQQAPAK